MTISTSQSNQNGLRPPLQHSPTSSTSSMTTTPTSPHFTQIAHVRQGHVHPHVYASAGNPRAKTSSSSLAAPSIIIQHPARPPTPPLYHPPASEPFSAYLKTWGDAEIATFLGLHKCAHYASTFQRNDIDGKVILDLDMASLKEMGISKVGERVKLLSGIKELRKRASTPQVQAPALTRAGTGLGTLLGSASSRVELRLNGAATPPLEDAPSSSPGLDGMHPRTHLPSSGLRRLHSTRPPPLDLHSHGTRHLPAGYTAVQSARSVQRGLSLESTTSRPPLVSHHSLESNHPTSISQSVPAPISAVPITSVPPPASSVPPPSRPSNLNLRAPPSRDGGRRSPSPVNGDMARFTDRPLPPAPGQSSAAEYASSIRYGEGRSTPTASTLSGASLPHSLPRAAHSITASSALHTGERKAVPPLQPGSRADPLIHRKNSSLSITGTGKSTSPIKNKFNNLISGKRSETANAGPVHPFAAGRTRDEDKRSLDRSVFGEPPAQPQPSQPQSGPGQIAQYGGSNQPSGHKRVPTGGYIVGPGGMILTGGANGVAGNGHRRPPSESQGSVSLEELRRQLVRFINTEDGTTRTVNVSSSSSGVEVLERVLRKFGKWSAGNMPSDTESDESEDRLEVDGWGVYAESDPDLDATPLSESELLGICLSHRDGSAVREKGLFLHRKNQKKTHRKKMEDFFGETPPPPMSPTSPSYRGPKLGHSIDADQTRLSPSKPTVGMGTKKMNRASTVSVMSGLGVQMPMSTSLSMNANLNAFDPPPSPTTAARSPGGSFLSKSKKMYNFFGHRPPSELISNHLAEYFPAVKKRELEKTVRHSMARVSLGPGMAPGKRSSYAPSERSTSLEIARGSTGGEISDATRRTSGERERHTPPRPRPISRATLSSPPPAGTILEEGEYATSAGGGDSGTIPRVSLSGDGGQLLRPSIDGEQPPLLPPFEPSTETLAESIQAYSPTPISKSRPKSIIHQAQRRGSAGSSKSRLSMLSQLRRNRDRSDTASMLTVDEITEKVENRRASTITFEDSDDGEENLDLPPVVDPGIVPKDDDEDEGDHDESEGSEEDSDDGETDGTESDDEDEDDDSDADDGEDEHGKAFTSKGSGRIIKWIKGALIGAGSFGSVFLGMDAQSGLLMAVKQVELPGGNSRNEEKKRTMVDALEREIELLKELQHENIVQYLDSSADDHNLNIFLEYVPGGSVAALLNNYGAFEEALVRNFCRQILTGLNYLHERGIIHRDIKGANILVDNKGGIKISDFGISKKAESSFMGGGAKGNAANRPSLQGSVFWMAPEVVQQTVYSEKADIWSVGCLVVEMLTGTHPWADLSQMQAIFKIGSSARPATPSDISLEAADFLQRTFEIDHNARPTASELLHHPFIAGPKGGPQLISVAAARATMNAAAASAQKGMGMQSLSALAAAS